MWIWWVFLPGYHVNVIATGLSTVDGIYALTGCSTPLNIKDRGCADSINVTYTHVPLAQTEKACPKAKKQILKVFLLVFLSQKQLETGTQGGNGILAVVVAECLGCHSGGISCHSSSQSWQHGL